MDADQFRKAAHSTIDDIINYYDTLEERPVVSGVEPGYLQKLIPDHAPQDGEQWEDIQKDIEDKIMPGLTHWQHPRYMAWFPCNSTYPGILGEMFSATFNSANFNWICSPAVTELETVMCDWVGKAINLPETFLSSGNGGGVIQGTASEAVITCIVAARERYLQRATAMLEGEAKQDRIDQLRSKLVAIASDQAHSCTAKGARIAGVRFKTIKTSLDDDLALRGADLRSTLDDCKAQGLHPFYLTVSLGATSTCAVDRFDEVAEVIKDHPDLWTHVDAAYAGAALILPEHQHLTKSFAAFDSFDLNLHKWLLVNFDCSVLFIQQRRDLTDALSVTPSYLRNDATDSGLVTDYRDWQLPLGRRFRSLKVWFVFRTYGIKGMQAMIRKHIEMGEAFADLVRTRGDVLKILTPPAFALTVLTCVPPSSSSPNEAIHTGGKTQTSETEGLVNGMASLPKVGDQELQAANKLTKEVYELINKRGEIFLTSGMVSGVYIIRVVSANPKAEMKYLQRAFEILLETTEEVIQSQLTNKLVAC